MAKRKSLKGYYLTTFLIGLGFFTMGLMDPLYDTYVPIFLRNFIESNTIVGLIMTFDNVLAIFLIPIFSALSDRVDTRIGRRMPFIVTLLPIAAVLFGLIPFSALSSLWLLIALVFCFNLSKQAVRGPVVALMPDMVPGDLRSEANGVINTMGGIATILGTVALARLMDVYIKLPGQEEPVNEILAFPVASLFVILAVVLLFIFVKERSSQVPREKAAKEKKESILQSLRHVVGEKDKSALFILISLLCWFISYQGVLPFVGLYSEEVLGTSSGTASLAAGMVGIAYAIFAIPSGKVAHRFGRKRTIRVSLVCLVAVTLLVFVHSFVTASWNPTVRLVSFWALLFLFGIFWVSVVTNSFPMLWQMSDYTTVGIYTGLYYFFSQAASIIAPPIAGGCIDLFGYPALFVFTAIFFAIAWITMSKVDRGEPEDLAVEA
ncbi:MAG: MFS transporter [Spirochaetes bacterium]|uniref:MFS transporter n=1 Tax=Candidatus Aphodenecus pullistercoris TaxID=2840669 RepID=A0A9D9E835_9SPIR|nr:MFS transporter [Candidatus Aphodenecus pullistercoris]